MVKYTQGVEDAQRVLAHVAKQKDVKNLRKGGKPMDGEFQPDDQVTNLAPEEEKKKVDTPEPTAEAPADPVLDDDDDNDDDEDD